MSTNRIFSSEEKEDIFPIKITRAIERKVARFRRLLRKKTIAIALSASPPEERIFTITEQHSDQAFSELFCPECLKLFSDNK